MDPSKSDNPSDKYLAYAEAFRKLSEAQETAFLNEKYRLILAQIKSGHDPEQHLPIISKHLADVTRLIELDPETNREENEKLKKQLGYLLWQIKEMT